MPITIPQQKLSCHTEEFRSHSLSMLEKNCILSLDHRSVPESNIHSSHLRKTSVLLVMNAVSEAFVQWMPPIHCVGHSRSL